MKQYFTKSMRLAGLVVAALWSMSFAVTDADWSALGSGMNFTVRALCIDSSGNLYAGGDFTTAGGTRATYIAEWNGSSWSTMGSGMNGTVNSLVADRNGNIYASGNFTTAGGITANYIAKWDGSSWSALGAGLNSLAKSLTFDKSGNLYAGGDFTTAGGTTANHIAKWNGSSWSALSTGMNNSVYTLAVDSNNNLYAGGPFTTAGGIAANCIAKWDGSTWSAFSQIIDNTIAALAIDNSGYIYAGGGFNTTAQHIAKWNGASWESLGSAGTSICYIDGLAASINNTMYITGYFTMLASTTASNILQWDGTQGTALGSGLNSEGTTLAYNSFSGKLYVGGTFTIAGGATRNYIASCKVANASAVSPPPSSALSPVNGTGGLATSVILNWNVVDGATKYFCQISTTSTFSTIFIQDSSLTTNSKYITGLSIGTTYYWRVRANNSIGSHGWSVVWHFTTAGTTPTTAPSMIYPANNATGLDTAIVLTWNTLSDATGYYVQVALNSTFSSPLVIQDSTLSTFTKNISGLANNTTYYWRVCGINVLGSGTFSPTQIFTTTINKTVLFQPSNGISNQTLPLVFNWKKVTNAVSYQLQVSPNNAFIKSMAIVDSSLNDTSMSYNGLASGTNYYWHVRAKTSLGDTSAWTSTFGFSTAIFLPATPTLLSPSNSSTGQTTNPTLTWNTVTGASSYNIQVSTINNFSSIVVQDSILYAGIKTLSTGLSLNTQYFWRVRAKNNAGVSAWSSVWIFSTATTFIPAPLLLSPTQGARGVGSTVAFSWNPVSNATKYCLEITTSSNFSTIFIEDSTLTSPSINISGFVVNTNYFWRVKGITNTGESGFWSSINNFSPGSSSIKRDGSWKTPTTLFITNAGSSIRYGLPASSQVSIKLYTLQGQLAATLYSGFQQSGVYTVTLPSQSLAKARYIVELKAGKRVITNRL